MRKNQKFFLMPTLSIIIPCYYNEENIPVTSRKLIENEALFDSNVSFEYVLVDDGSKDRTWKKLLLFKQEYPDKVKLIKLAKNTGSFNAILAGLHIATGDINVVLAADLQDPPELIPTMYTHWQNGFKLVIANRQDREESWQQKLFSNTFHFLMKSLALKNVPKGGFDLVMFDKKLRDEIIKIDEKNSNILYLLCWLGYEYVNIPYVRRKCEIGKSKWTTSKKIKMFIDSFIAFSFFPIRAISVLGLLLGVIALLYAFVVIIARITGWIEVEGWTTMMVVLLFVSAFQMIGLGIIGEYVWRGLDASRRRPNFIVEETIK
jgi:polyisoprenyl-phosphate glycosyltransferase